MHFIAIRRCNLCNNKIHVGSTITSFRKRFHNHKSSINKYERSRIMAAEHLYAHSFDPGHN